MACKRPADELSSSDETYSDYLQKHKRGMTLFLQPSGKMISLENNDKWLSFNLTVSFSAIVQAPNPYNGVREKKKKRNYRFELCFAPRNKTPLLTRSFLKKKKVKKQKSKFKKWQSWGTYPDFPFLKQNVSFWLKPCHWKLFFFFLSSSLWESPYFIFHIYLSDHLNDCLSQIINRGSE